MMGSKCPTKTLMESAKKSQNIPQLRYTRFVRHDLVCYKGVSDDGKRKLNEMNCVPGEAERPPLPASAPTPFRPLQLHPASSSATAPLDVSSGTATPRRQMLSKQLASATSAPRPLCSASIRLDTSNCCTPFVSTAPRSIELISGEIIHG